MDPSTFSARIWILAKTDVMWVKQCHFLPPMTGNGLYKQ